jgi:hypothetical protein
VRARARKHPLSTHLRSRIVGGTTGRAFAFLSAASVNATDGENTVIVKITPNDKGNPPGTLADAELHFTEGILEGLKLIGFSVWERRTGGGRNVTFPARQYSVNGERRSFSLLRPIGDATAQDRIREAILQAYTEYEEKAAVAT